MAELQHPDITRALLWGYPKRPRPQLCPLCGEELGEYSYELTPGEFICEDCFKEQCEDFIRMSPRQAAEAMNINWRYRF